MDKNRYKDEIVYECACPDLSSYKWDELMKGAIKANGSKIKKMIKEQIPWLYRTLALEYSNPYENRSQRTKTHYIYVHSGIEYFLHRCN